MPSPFTSAFCCGQFGYVCFHSVQFDKARTKGLMSSKLMTRSQFRSPRQIVGPFRPRLWRPPAAMAAKPVFGTGTLH